ncbi:MAG: SPOR domain-containing protein [Desulfobacterota bacterium]|nr:SPOR domain-containing protein [Thermodesulfobacteriota bacterium]
MWIGIIWCLCLISLSPAESQPDAIGQGSYCIQVIVLSSRAAADSYIHELRQKGYDAFIAPMQTRDGSTKYRVRIGSFAREEEARKFGIAFSEKEKKPHVVVRLTDHPPAPTANAHPSVPAPTPKPTDNATLEEPEDIDEHDLPEERIPQPPEHPASLQQEVTKTASPPFVSETPAESSTGIDAGSDRVIKIFAYRKPDGTLTITNNYFSIPEQSRKDIQYISVYPITVISYNASTGHIICMIDGAKKPVVLAGICLPQDRHSSLVSDYVAHRLAKELLRIRYSPWHTTDQGAIIGKLYTREGTLINIDLLKSGLGTFCADTAPPEQHGALKSAQEYARREKKGIWAHRQQNAP